MSELLIGTTGMNADETGDRPSYQKINYTLRPAKNIERKMIAEGMRSATKTQFGQPIPVCGVRFSLFQRLSPISQSLGVSENDQH